MTRTDYGWKRFWCPRGETINVTNDGFLMDPESAFTRPLNKHVVPLSSLSAI